ncbi:MAG: peptidoglycan-associated lipoprotein Pal [Gammaproteobacteria bacterium]|nr:peptidoglycan-associated lipoprotein Pal [Gammaproteobacteria bacterium]
MNVFKALLVLVFSVTLLTGCPSTPSRDDSNGGRGGGAGAGSEGSGVQGQGADMSGGVSAMSLQDPASTLSKRVIYFDYNSAAISDEGRELIDLHAQYLSAHPESKVVLEGHTDERGSREYNIALGERRAAAVQKIMQLLGVSATQLQAISFGEERPVDPGHMDDAWQANRRVELLYTEHR